MHIGMITQEKPRPKAGAFLIFCYIPFKSSNAASTDLDESLAD